MRQLVLLSLLFGAACASSNIVLFDSRTGAYLQPGEATLRNGGASVSSVVAAVTGLLPAERVDAGLSAQLEAFVKPSAFKKPQAYVVVNVPGISADVANEAIDGRQQVSVALEGTGCIVSASVNALTAMVASNPGASLYLLDQDGLQDCDSACLEQHLQSAGPACKVQMTPSANAAMQGKLTLPNGASLDLEQAEDRLFAVELAGVLAGMKSRVQQLAARAALKEGSQDTELYELNVMGLHGLAKRYGADSEQAAGAREAVAQLLQWAVQSLDEAYSGDVVYQVAVSASTPAEGIKAITAWKDASRRQLLQAAWAKPDETLAAKRFSAKAAGYGSFILLLYFSLAAMHCMCNMPFKADTLLFPSQKKDQ